MKKLYFLSFLLFAATTMFGQSLSNTEFLQMTKHARVPVSVPSKHNVHNSTLATSSFNIDYDWSDSMAQEVNGNTWRRYAWDFNGHYSGIDSSLKYVMVVYDSITDSYNDNTGYPDNAVQTVTVDSLFLILGQENNSGIQDTIVCSILGLNASDYPGATVLWTQNMIIDSLGTDHNWLTSNLVTFVPAFSLPTGVKRFAVKVEYLGNKLDTCGMIAGFGFNGTCAALGGLEISQTTLYSPVGNTGLSTNSYAFWTRPGFNQVYPTSAGGDLYYDCTGNGSFDAGSDPVNLLQNINFIAGVTVQNNLSVRSTDNGTMKLAQNKPNPVKGISTVSYTLQNSSAVTFEITDITGRIVKTYNEGTQSSGHHELTIRSSDFSSGVYFYTMKSGNTSLTKRMIIAE